MKKMLLVALLALPLLAQTKSKPIDVTVKQINDRRTSGQFFAHLTISLELPKVRASEVAASRVLVASAVDDTGRNLVETSDSEPRLESSGGSMSSRDEGPASVDVQLKNPDRKAKTVREVKGEIELYMPSKDPTSTAEVPRFLSTAGKPLNDRSLSANGVEITLLSTTQLAAERKRLGDAKRKEAKESGLDGEDLENYEKQYLEYTLKLDEGELALRIKDPNKRIHQIAYVDAAGDVKHVSMSDDNGLTKLSTWGDKPQADWKLRVSMKTAKNVVRYAFGVSGVVLP